MSVFSFCIINWNILCLHNNSCEHWQLLLHPRNYCLFPFISISSNLLMAESCSLFLTVSSDSLPMVFLIFPFSSMISYNCVCMASRLYCILVSNSVILSLIFAFITSPFQGTTACKAEIIYSLNSKSILDFLKFIHN